MCVQTYLRQECGLAVVLALTPDESGFGNHQDATSSGAAWNYAASRAENFRKDYLYQEKSKTTNKWKVDRIKLNSVVWSCNLCFSMTGIGIILGIALMSL
jgi:hypothetical protein